MNSYETSWRCLTPETLIPIKNDTNNYLFLFFLDDIDLELRLTRFENLMERRLLLLNSVCLRQNPHNVFDWHERVSLYEGQPHEVNFVHINYTIQYLTINFFYLDHKYIYRGSTDSAATIGCWKVAQFVGIFC